MSSFGNIRGIKVAISKDETTDMFAALAAIADNRNPAARTALSAFFDPDGDVHDRLSFYRTNGGEMIMDYAPLAPLEDAASLRELIASLARALDELNGVVAKTGDKKFDHDELKAIVDRLSAAVGVFLAQRYMRAEYLGSDELLASLSALIRASAAPNSVAEAAAVADEVRQELAAEGPGHGGIFGGAHSGALASEVNPDGAINLPKGLS